MFSPNCWRQKYFFTNKSLEDHLWQYLRRSVLKFLLIFQICTSAAFRTSFSEIGFRGGQKWILRWDDAILASPNKFGVFSLFMGQLLMVDHIFVWSLNARFYFDFVVFLRLPKFTSHKSRFDHHTVNYHPVDYYLTHEQRKYPKLIRNAIYIASKAICPPAGSENGSRKQKKYKFVKSIEKYYAESILLNELHTIHLLQNFVAENLPPVQRRNFHFDYWFCTDSVSYETTQKSSTFTFHIPCVEGILAQLLWDLHLVSICFMN